MTIENLTSNKQTNKNLYLTLKYLDSEPSYTNSSDGLDIYDQIGAHARLNHHHRHHNHHQFLDLPGAHNLAPEVHVGEWENMYER